MFNLSQKIKETKEKWLHFLYPDIFKKRRHLKDFFIKTKNGAVTGAADNDPAGIVTYIQTGASTGYSLLWLIFLMIPLLIAVEEIAARLSIVTKKGLTSIIREQFGKRLAVLVALIVIFANVATIGADLASMAEVLGLVLPLPNYFFSILFFLLFAILLLRGNYASVSRFFFFLTPIFLAYVVSAFLAQPDWLSVAKSTINPFILSGKNNWLLAVAVLGTTLSPYLIFWQGTEELEEQKKVKDLKEETAGVRWGMIYSNLIFYFIVVAGAACLFTKGIEINTVKDMALALNPVAGDFAFLVLTLGLLGSGFLAIPLLTASSAYVWADAMHWEKGLNKKITQAKGFYRILFASLLFGLGIAISGINPIKVLIYSQVLSGLLMPFLLFFLLRVGLDSKIMGKHLPSFWIKLFGWLALIIFILADIAMFLS